jgi:alkylation response protein AidB-like acyl-CoA dehydrogenase
MVAAHEAKWMAKETLEKIMWSAAEVCGSTSLFEKHPLERFYRDMHLHMMHGRRRRANRRRVGARRALRRQSDTLEVRIKAKG